MGEENGRGESVGRVPVPHTASALAWIVDLLQRHHLPFRAVGGLAARAYGATRELVDLDFYAPMDQLGPLLGEIAPHVTCGPAHGEDEHWDMTFAKLTFAGQQIEIGDSVAAFFRNRKSGEWIQQTIAYERSVRCEILGVAVPVIPKAELVAYNRLLDREVDRLDLAEIGA